MFAQFANGKVCYVCGKKGHIFSDCTKRESTPKREWHINKSKEVKQYHQMVEEIRTFQNTQVNSSNDSVASADTSSRPEDAFHFLHYFSGVQRATPMRDTMVLDSGSSIDLFCNETWLKNIHASNTPTSIGTNAGSLEVTKRGTLPLFVKVPYSKEAITNILSLIGVARCTPERRRRRALCF